MTKEQCKMIDEAIDAMDWKDVANMYKATKWTWYFGDDSCPPSADELRKVARDMCYDVVSESHYMRSTGGITVVYNKDVGTIMLFVGFHTDGGFK